MSALLRRLLREWKSLQRFKSLSPEEREIVFYAEGAHDWPHFSPIVEALTESLQRAIVYLTSQEDDPILLAQKHSNVLPLYIGSGAVRTLLINTMEAQVLVMTLPDLNQYHLKRSTRVGNAVYLFHSINSTHMVYRKGAFDAYDTILCTGPHHVKEIQRTEELYGLKKKCLLKHGYGRLDSLIRDRPGAAGSSPSGVAQDPYSRQRKVLIAPSWGRGSLIESEVGRPLVKHLKQAGFQVTLRVHPMTVRHHPTLASAFRDEFAITVETDMNSKASLEESDIMISDWSGAAFEYAFFRERPVIFIDTPAKINNPEYEELAITPLEMEVRPKMGRVIRPDEIEKTGAAIEELCKDPQAMRERLGALREKTIFNVGNSGAVGARQILEVSRESSQKFGRKNMTDMAQTTRGTSLSGEGGITGGRSPKHSEDSKEL